jgi:hypothetical protein
MYLFTYLSDRAMAQAVSRRPLTAEAWVRARLSPRGIYNGQRDTGTCFSSISSIFSPEYHPIVVIHTHISSGE